MNLPLDATELPPPAIADLAPSWQTTQAWMAGDSLYVRNAPTPTRIQLQEVDNILIVDASTRRTPTWAVVLAVLGAFFFLLGLLFLLVKETKEQSRVTIYVRGNLGAPISVWSPYGVDRTQAEWYPVLAAIGR